MNHGDPTQGEVNAMRRVAAGSDVDLNAWQELHRKGMVERSQGKRVLTDKGKNALGRRAI